MKVEGAQLNTTLVANNSTFRQGSQQIVRQDATAKETRVPSERRVSEEQVVKAVEKANKSFEPFDRRFEISVHEKMNAVMIKVIDATNDEVIREIPSEKILDMVAYMLEVAGIIIDEKV